ncbi:hypothetical protein [Lederbergia citrea]|uniref:hypothetical protein n=1 Tax=Lederbergia citrea TaxID=2833581 RepID=UPI001BC91E2E|nr:hypothetical protein [Lederbergia citrea]MBS4205719.1 hypothetical protein [Lederbergia citrea]
MKKLIFLLMGTLLLTTACSSKDSEQKPVEKEEVAVDSGQNEEFSKFPEYSIVSEQIPSAEYEVSVETDSEDERVLLFENKQGKSYKGIYLKNRDILQIRDLEEDRLIYNKIFRP